MGLRHKRRDLFLKEITSQVKDMNKEERLLVYCTIIGWGADFVPLKEIKRLSELLKKQIKENREWFAKLHDKSEVPDE